MSARIPADIEAAFLKLQQFYGRKEMNVFLAFPISLF